MKKRSLALLIVAIAFLSVVFSSCSLSDSDSKDKAKENTTKTVEKVIDNTQTSKNSEEAITGEKTDKTVVSYIYATDTTKKETTYKNSTTNKTTKITTKKTNKTIKSSGTYATAGPGNTGYSDSEGIWSPRY